MTARPLRFRRSAALTVAAVLVVIAGLSLATWAVYLLPLLVIPLAIALWSWRAGTDVDRSGVTVRAALGKRRVPWSQITELVADPGGRVAARLSSGATLTLTAVPATALPRVVAAAGETLERAGGPHEKPGEQREEG